MTNVKKIFDENISPVGFKEWGYDKSLREILDTCDNESWLLWILSVVLGTNDTLFIYIKSKCANTIRHIIKNQEVLNLIDSGFLLWDNSISYLNYIDIKQKAEKEQTKASELALSTKDNQLYLNYCLQSISSRWIHDNDGYSSFKLSVELDNAINPTSIPYSQIKNEIIYIIKNNTLHLN